jgi:hypothetical protein
MKISLSGLAQNRYNSLPESSVWTQDALLRVEELAGTLDENEIFRYFCIDEEELGQIDRRIFRMAYERGIVIFKAKMGDKLVAAAGDRNGGALTLQVLNHFSPKWKGIVSDQSGGSSVSGGWSLRIVKPDED